MNQITTMPDEKWWPFARQKDFDQFMSQIKGDNRNLKESAIRAWIEARTKPTQGVSDGTQS